MEDDRLYCHPYCHLYCRLYCHPYCLCHMEEMCIICIATSTVRSILRNNSLSQFESAVADLRVDEEVGELPLTVEHVKTGLEAVTMMMFPHRALFPRLMIRRVVIVPVLIACCLLFKDDLHHAVAGWMAEASLVPITSGVKLSMAAHLRGLLSALAFSPS